MDRGDPITAAVFAAFLKCPTKAHLLMIGKFNPATFFTDIQAQISSMHKAASPGQFSGMEFADVLDIDDTDYSQDQAVPRLVDCKSARYDLIPSSLFTGRSSRHVSPHSVFALG